MRDEEREKNQKLATRRLGDVLSQIEKALKQRDVAFRKEAGGSLQDWAKFDLGDGREIRVDLAWKRGYGYRAGGPTGGIRVKFTRHFRTLNRYPPAKDGFPKMKRLLKDVDSLGAQIGAEKEGEARLAKEHAAARKAQGREVGYHFPDTIRVSRGNTAHYEMTIDGLKNLTPDEVVRVTKALYPAWEPKVKS